MQKELFVKMSLIALVLVVLLIALALIGEQISERAALRQAAKQDIERSWSKPQEIIGPLLLVSFKEQKRETTHGEGEHQTISRVIESGQSEWLVPADLKIKSQLAVEERYRGIYSFPVYTSSVELEAVYDIPTDLREKFAASNPKARELHLVLGISDILSMQNAPVCIFNDRELKLAAGTQQIFPGGMQTSLDASGELPALLNFDCKFQLRGSESFRIAPVGKSTRFSLGANWGHPDFEGAFLPLTREINAESFIATWQTSHFASSWSQLNSLCGESISERCGGYVSGGIGVSLYQPVDIYQSTERAIKYGILFITLTFAGFFMLEVLSKTRIHPIQYAFVGSALAVFYLLLLSLSEHVSFAFSYALAATACLTLLVVYTRHALGNSTRSTCFGISLASLYVVLYVVLRSEDYALLMGTCLIFAALGILMIATRSVNWYAITENDRSKEARPA